MLETLPLYLMVLTTTRHTRRKRMAWSVLTRKHVLMSRVTLPIELLKVAWIKRNMINLVIGNPLHPQVAYEFEQVSD